MLLKMTDYNLKDRKCYRCSKPLFGYPKISVLTDNQSVKQIYCFHCAKNLIRSMTPIVVAEHNRRLDAYCILKHEYEEKLIIYNAVYEPSLGTFGWLTIICISILVGIAVQPLAGVIIFLLMTSLASGGDDQKISEKKDAYKKANPILDSFNETEPTLAQLWSIIHYPLPSDGSITSEGYDKYRYNILFRDNYTCQKCGLPFSGDNLEVHHIIPKVNHGTDNPTNLVTLCLGCHDKETWYGHFRVNRRVDNGERIQEPGTYIPQGAYVPRWCKPNI